MNAIDGTFQSPYFDVKLYVNLFSDRLRYDGDNVAEDEMSEVLGLCPSTIRCTHVAIIGEPERMRLLGTHSCR
jgi:hypothetical protein